MKRKWTDIQTAEPMIQEMRKEGRTRQEIADALGLEKVQIKNWINRYNRRQGKAPVTARKKGRPRKRPITEAEAMVARIRELEQEVVLYRSFLQAVGRR
jgi:transposase-like protein